MWIRPWKYVAYLAVLVPLSSAPVLAELQRPQPLLKPLQQDRKQPPASQEQMQQLERRDSAERSACPFTTHHVSRRAPAGGDGSVRQPFQQPSQALAAGPAPGHCGIRVEIRAGSYDGNLAVTAPTILHGAAFDKGAVVITGSIGNHTGAPLTVEHLVMRGAPSPGAIDVAHADAQTTLRDITIEQAGDYGIRQRGGRLLAENVRVNGTRSRPAAAAVKPRPLQLFRKALSPRPAVSAGSGIFVDGGATATLDDVSLTDNHQGLVVAGHGTRLRATGLQVDRHRGNPALQELMCASSIRNGFAAVEVRDGALAHMEDVSLDDNEVYGLSVHHGGKAYAGRVSIQRTGAPAACAETRTGGGINASVRHGGSALELVDLDLGHARLAGFQVINADASLRNGTVHHNTIGVHIRDLPEGFDFACLTEGVRFSDNGLNLDADRLPVPDADLPSGSGDSAPSGCAQVRWP